MYFAADCKSAISRFNSGLAFHCIFYDNLFMTKFLIKAGMAELADARDLKSRGLRGPCGFKSHSRHHIGLQGLLLEINVRHYCCATVCY